MQIHLNNLACLRMYICAVIRGNIIIGCSDDELRFKDYLICPPEVDMDAKLTENDIFVRGTGKDFVLQFIKMTFNIQANHVHCVIYALCLKIKEKMKCKDQQGLFYVALQRHLTKISQFRRSTTNTHSS